MSGDSPDSVRSSPGGNATEKDSPAKRRRSLPGGDASSASLAESDSDRSEYDIQGNRRFRTESGNINGRFDGAIIQQGKFHKEANTSVSQLSESHATLDGSRFRQVNLAENQQRMDE